MKITITVFLLITILFTTVLSSCKKQDTQAETAEETTAETETEQITETIQITETETETETETDPIDTETTVELSLPQKSSDMSYDTALQLLEFCAGYNERNTAVLLNNAGFEILFTKNFDKQITDISHTCAFTVAKGKYIGKNVYLVVIRGTDGGEWYSNFDFAPSHNNDTKYAENFYLAAQDVYLSVKDLFDGDTDSYKVICGHSRGAAASNLLGVMLDNVYDKNNIYVYTFATPNTVRGEEAEKDTVNEEEKKYNNIFNFINQADVVTHVPVEAHGFSRAGRDIIINTADNNGRIIKAVESLSLIAPDINSYYEKKYSLIGKGTSEFGLSLFDVLRILAAMFAANAKQADLSMLSNMSKDSELYSALTLLTDFSDSNEMTQVGNEHTVTRYMQLIMNGTQTEG